MASSHDASAISCGVISTEDRLCAAYSIFGRDLRDNDILSVSCQNLRFFFAPAWPLLSSSRFSRSLFLFARSCDVSLVGEGLRGCTVALPTLAGSDAFKIDSRSFIVSESGLAFTFVFIGPATFAGLATAGLLLSLSRLAFPPILPIRGFGFAAVLLVLSFKTGFEATICWLSISVPSPSELDAVSIPFECKSGFATNSFLGDEVSTTCANESALAF